MIRRSASPGPRLLAASLLLASAGAARAEVAIEHKAVDCLVAREFPVLEACLSPVADLARARLYFRSEAGPSWYYVDMKQEGPCFKGILPRPLPTTPRIHYYVDALDKTFAESRTAEYAPDVVSGVGACKKGGLAAPTVPGATVLVGGGAAGVVPIGFAAGGIAGVGAGVGAVAVVGAVVGGGAAVAGVVSATGGDDTPSTTAPPVTTLPPPPPPPTPPTPFPEPPPPAENGPPAALLAVTPDPPKGPAPLAVVLNLCRSSDPDGDTLAYTFDFGDGTRDEGSCRTEHTYAAGRYGATACVDDRHGHTRCREAAVEADAPPPPPPAPTIDCSTDKAPPTASVTQPTAGQMITTSTFLLEAAASDGAGSGVVRVVFHADRLDGPDRFTGEDLTAPYGVTWPVPDLCHSPFAVSVDAFDACGNLTSAAPVFVSDARCGGSSPVSARLLLWASQLDVPDAAGQAVVSGSWSSQSTRERAYGTADLRSGTHRVTGQLTRGSGRAGTWRFDLGGSMAAGTLRVIEGQPALVLPDAIVFRLNGAAGERVAFTFDVR